MSQTLLLDLVDLMGQQMGLATTANVELTKAVGQLTTAVLALSEEQMRLIEAVNRLTIAYATQHAIPIQGLPN